jgi:hypothetical protein
MKMCDEEGSGNNFPSDLDQTIDEDDDVTRSVKIMK